MKYRIKDDSLEKLVYSIFEEEDVQRQIAKQMEEGEFDPIIICSFDEFDDSDDLTTEVKPEYEPLEKKRCSVAIFINVDEIEKIREFDPNGWNPFPQVLPPERKRYLIQFEDDSGAKKLDIGSWIKSNTEEENKGLWESYKVVAFRELPPFFDPKELEK